MNRRGIQRERDVVKRLRDNGWFAQRSPASKGPVDVLALKAGHPTRFVQVKSTARSAFADFGPAERDELIEVAALAGAEPWLCWWPPRAKPQWIPTEEWPGDRA